MTPTERHAAAVERWRQARIAYTNALEAGDRYLAAVHHQDACEAFHEACGAFTEHLRGIVTRQ